MVENAKDLKAKGALLVPLAVIINNMKGVNWAAEGNLSEEEMRSIRKGILASQWYPRDLLERMGMAVYNVAGGGKAEGGFQFGQGIMAEKLLKIYRNPLTENSPKEILMKFASFYNGTWFNGGHAEFTLADRGGVFSIRDQDGIPCQVCFVPMMRGVFTRLVQENGGKNVKVEAVEEPLILKEKINTLTLNIYWE